jgi:hypothetical protein
MTMELMNDNLPMLRPLRASPEPQPGSLPDPEPVDTLTELSSLFHAPVIPFLYHPIDI